MNLKRILPMEQNLVLKNFKDIIFQKEYEGLRLTDRPRCFFMDAASYGNLGDQAIALAIEMFLRDCLGEENVLVISEKDVLKYLNSLKRQINSSDLIVLSGGGNMGDMYPRYEAIRRVVVQAFPRNRIVIFPQTLDYREDAYGQRELRRSAHVYSKHEKLYICAREHESYKLMRNMYPNVILIPDIVFYLYGKLEFADKNPKQGVGICFRHDRESVLTASQEEELIKLCTQESSADEHLTTMSEKSSAFMTYEDRKMAVSEKLEEFAQYKLVITDRLHGMIFSILAGTPCLAFDNSNHKISGVYSWLKDSLQGVCLYTGEDLDTLGGRLPQVDAGENAIKPERMYAELAKMIRGDG